MSDLKNDITNIAKLAKESSKLMGQLSSSVKDKALLAMACGLEENKAKIFAANKLDMEAGKENGLTGAMLDRLLLTEERVDQMAGGLREIASLPDPVGEISGRVTRPTGIEVARMLIAHVLRSRATLLKCAMRLLWPALYRDGSDYSVRDSPGLESLPKCSAIPCLYSSRMVLLSNMPHNLTLLG